MKVLVVGHIHQDGINLLQTRADLTIEITEAHNESDLVNLVSDVDAILVRSALITSSMWGRASWRLRTTWAA